MAIRIPVAERKVNLDAAAQTMPRHQADDAIAKSIAKVGDSMMVLGLHIQRQREQLEDWKASRSLSQANRKIMEFQQDALQKFDPESEPGTYHDSVKKGAEGAYKEWFDRLPPRLQEKYKDELPELTGIVSSNAANDEYKTRNQYFTARNGQFDKLVAQAAMMVKANPSSYNTVAEMVKTQLSSTEAFTTRTQRQAAVQGALHTLGKTARESFLERGDTEGALASGRYFSGEIDKNSAIRPQSIGPIKDRTSDAGFGERFGRLESVKGIIVHHTAGGATADDTIATFKKRGFPAHYVVEPDGTVVQTLPDGARGQHMRNGQGPGAGLSNANTIGIEVIARDNRGVTPQQKAATIALIQQKSQQHNIDPAKATFGHGEVNGHKESDEGMAIVAPLRGGTAGGTKTAAGGASAREREALQFFMERGLTRAQAAGVVGNLKQEQNDLDPNAVHDGGKGIGIAGWNGDRRARLEGAGGKGDFQKQLEFLWLELQGPERKALEAIKSAQNPRDAAVAAQGFFRPGEPMTENRIANATSAFGKVTVGADGKMTIGDAPTQVAALGGGTASDAAPAAGWPRTLPRDPAAMTVAAAQTPPTPPSFSEGAAFFSATESAVAAHMMEKNSEAEWKKTQYKTMLDNDIKGVMATGKTNPNVIYSETEKLYGKSAADYHEQQRGEALRYNSITKDFYRLTEQEIYQRLNDIAPSGPQGNPTLFGQQHAAFEAARKNAKELIERREADPAVAVSDFPEVKAAIAGGDRATIAKARMDAQRQLGLPEVPLTNAEQKLLIAPLARAAYQDKFAPGKPGSESPVLSAQRILQEDLVKTYGPEMAERVMLSSFQQLRRDKYLTNEITDQFSVLKKEANTPRQVVSIPATARPEQPSVQGGLNDMGAFISPYSPEAVAAVNEKQTREYALPPGMPAMMLDATGRPAPAIIGPDRNYPTMNYEAQQMLLGNPHLSQAASEKYGAGQVSSLLFNRAIDAGAPSNVEDTFQGRTIVDPASGAEEFIPTPHEKEFEGLEP